MVWVSFIVPMWLWPGFGFWSWIWIQFRFGCGGRCRLRFGFGFECRYRFRSTQDLAHGGAAGEIQIPDQSGGGKGSNNHDRQGQRSEGATTGMEGQRSPTENARMITMEAEPPPGAEMGRTDPGADWPKDYGNSEAISGSTSRIGKSNKRDSDPTGSDLSQWDGGGSKPVGKIILRTGTGTGGIGHPEWKPGDSSQNTMEGADHPEGRPDWKPVKKQPIYSSYWESKQQSR